MKVLVSQSCPILCYAMGYNPPGSSVHGILPARILEWVCHSLLQGIFPTQEPIKPTFLTASALVASLLLAPPRKP